MSERCVFCGEEIPEGRQLCPACEHGAVEALSKPRLSDAMAMLVEKTIAAQKKPWMSKPIAWALHETWKFFNATE